jgi:molybdopterin synthase catalytic subunit
LPVADVMQIGSQTIRPDELRAQMADSGAGAYAAFEGWIRNENDGRTVVRLEYEAYEPLAVKEGELVLREAALMFPILQAKCVHRTGLLEIGECAVWVGVSAPHRDEAFAACRYIIDQVKVRLPIWKKEHYADGHSGWVNCERCASHAEVAAAALSRGRSA